MAGDCQGPEPCRAAGTGTVCPSPLTAAQASLAALLTQTPSHRLGRAPLSPDWPQSPASALQCCGHSCGMLSKGDKKGIPVQSPCLAVPFQMITPHTGMETTLRQERGKGDCKLSSSP